MSARNRAVGAWVERAWRRYRIERDEPPLPVAVEIAEIIVEQADMLDTKLNQRYIGGSYRVRLTNVPGMRTKTFHGESAWSSAARYASDAAAKCGDWRWHPDL